MDDGGVVWAEKMHRRLLSHEQGQGRGWHRRAAWGLACLNEPRDCRWGDATLAWASIGPLRKLASPRNLLGSSSPPSPLHRLTPQPSAPTAGIITRLRIRILSPGTTLLSLVHPLVESRETVSAGSIVPSPALLPGKQQLALSIQFAGCGNRSGAHHGRRVVPLMAVCPMLWGQGRCGRHHRRYVIVRVTVIHD